MANNFLQAAQQFVGRIVQNNAANNFANVPWKQDAINAIMSGDQSKGQELANNILQSYGFSSPEEAIQKGFQNLNGNIEKGFQNLNGNIEKGFQNLNSK